MSEKLFVFSIPRSGFVVTSMLTVDLVRLGLASTKLLEYLTLKSSPKPNPDRLEKKIWEISQDEDVMRS